MVYRSSIEGSYGGDASVFHADASHPDRVDIPDAELLFRGHFARSGPDLVLTGQDGHRHIVPDYFATEKHPDLIAPNGAHLSGDTVSLLAGSPAPGQYAQAGTVLPPEAIGKVEKVVGQVTLIHNGVSGPLHVGDAVYKTDVVETGPNSSCGIGFPDGTALDLVAGTRMALNDYSFDANNAGANNALFTLVEGTFAFVAGQVAHTGDGMRITTPVATMGIRGTVGLFRSEPTVINANLGHVWSVFLHEDLDGSHHLGRIALIDQDPTSPTYGQVFYLLDSSEYIAYLEPRGPGLPPQVRLEPITNAKIFEDQHFYDDLGQIINSYINGNVNPQSVPGTPGSGTPPDLLKIEFQPFPGNGNQPTNNYIPPNNGFTPNLPPPINPGGIPVQPGENPNNHNNTNNNTPPPNNPSINFIWNSTGTGAWPTDLSDWNQGAAPNSSIDTVEIQTGTVNYDLGIDTTISFLTVDQGATLEVTAGQLTAGGLIDDGTIIVEGDPGLVIDGPVTIGGTGKIEVVGSGAEVDFDGSTVPGSTVDNQGVIAARRGGIVDFTDEGVTNDAGARIVARGNGSKVDFNGTGLSSEAISNLGIIAARHHGTISFNDTVVFNNLATSEDGTNEAGKIQSAGRGSTITFSDGATLSNYGIVVAADHGRIDFDGGSVFNLTTPAAPETLKTIPGKIEAIGGSTISFSHGATLFNEGVVRAEDGGQIDFRHAVVNNDTGGEIEADRFGTVSFFKTTIDNEAKAAIGAVGHAAQIVIDDSSLTNAGILAAADCGSVCIDDAKIRNQSAGAIDAREGGIVKIDASSVLNRGKIEADHAGKIEIRDSIAANMGTIEAVGLCSAVILSGDLIGNTGVLAAEHGGSLWITDSTVQNDGASGAIDAEGCGSTVAICNDSIANKHGATIAAADFGTITFDYDTVVNQHGSAIEAAKGGLIEIAYSEVTNEDGSFIRASDGGVVTLAEDYVTNTGASTIEAQGHHSTVNLENVLVMNDGGTIAAVGRDAKVDLQYAVIVGGRLITSDGGVIETVAGPDGQHTTSAFDNLTNEGYVLVQSDTTLVLEGTIHNDGTIVVDAEGHHGADLQIDGTVVVDGCGSVALDGRDDAITAGPQGGTLVNDSTIAGYGWIGNGSESLKLVNASGVIDANHDGEALVLDTGHQTIDNDGLLAASCGGTLHVESTVDNSCGWIAADAGGKVDLEGLVLGGSATIAGGTLTYTAALGVETTFANTTPGETSSLVLDGTGLSFITDTIAGFGHGDVIDLADMAFNSATTFKLWGDFLTVYDGSLFGPSITLQLDGDYNAGNIVLSDDGHGDTEVTFNSSLLITGAQTTANSYSTTAQSHGSDPVRGMIAGTISFDDPDGADIHATSSPDGQNYAGTFHIQSTNEDDGTGSVAWSFDFNNVNLLSGQTLTQSYDVTVADQQGATAAQQISVSIGGPGNDNFVFQPGIGADTIADFNPLNDTIELDHFANIQNTQELEAAITTDAHGDAVIALGHNDSIAIPGVSASYLQQHLQSLVHLH